MTPAWLEKLPERIRSKIAPPDERGCMLWLGCRSRKGYALARFDGASRYVHRHTYVAANGSYPEGLQTDHVCRVRHCVNPEHLEAVTARENVRRGLCGALHTPTTTCPHGHSMADCYSYRSKGRVNRVCRTCSISRASKAVAP